MIKRHKTCHFRFINAICEIQVGKGMWLIGDVSIKELDKFNDGQIEKGHILWNNNYIICNSWNYFNDCT